MALVSNTKYGNMVELADETSTPTGSVALYAKAAGSGNNEHLVLYAPTASFTGDVHVTGTLHVEGTINSVNRNETNLIVDDKTITVASGSSAEGDVDGAGINFGGTGDSAFASLLFEKDNLGGSSHHLLSSTAFKATGEIHGTTLSGSGPIKTADAIESVGNMRSEGNVTAEGNLAAVGGNLTVGSYGLTNAGALTIASMAGNWTNAGREVADMGTVTTMVLNGGTANGVTIGGATPAAGTFTALVAEGNVDLGNATSDTITATGRFDSNLVPSTDSTRALGTSDRQWLEIHVDVGHIDQLGSALDCNNQAMTNVDINGGAIDGTAIGAASRSSVACTTLDANGNVTLGSDTSDTVTINGTVGNFAAGTITGTEFVATSDARLKTNIQGVTNAMDVINSIQGVEYELTENGQHSMGVLAQDLIEVAPSLVKTRENGNYAVNYSGLSAFFVEAIKEQQAQIEDLKNTVKELSK